MTTDRLHRIAAQYAAARRRARDAREAGDTDGYRYATAEARRLAAILGV